LIAKPALLDWHIPPGGGPPPHRHDFEETFIHAALYLDVSHHAIICFVPTASTNSNKHARNAVGCASSG